MKEKELVAQRELILSHKEQKESEILDMQAQLDVNCFGLYASK
jgi:hypothetical protein